MNKIKYIAILIAISTFVVYLAGCTKTDFETPPAPTYTVDFETNSDYTMITIKDLKDLYNLGDGDTATITENYVIKGTVISDDTEGNFYKTIVFQDSTGGMAMPIEGYDLQKKYPQGQLIYIPCKGLVLQNYRNAIQLSFMSNQSVENIPGGLISYYLNKCDGGLPIVPRVIGINDLNPELQNTLVKFENVQFTAADTSKTYYHAASGYYEGANRNIEDCDGRPVILRNSEFSNFADTKVAKGNGSITAIYNVYSSYKQLYIRSLDDVDMEGERCSK